MIRAERHRRIMEIGREREVVTLEELADILSVSVATVRRDTDELCRQEMLEKTRGGIIVRSVNPNREPSLKLRSYLNMEEKERIAQAAAGYVENHTCCMLDSGSTVHELLKRIPAKYELSLVTYDMSFLAELAGLDHADVFFTGGQLRKEHLSCHGIFAEEMLNRIKADTAFIGADAVDLEKGIMGFNTNDIAMKQKMIENSAKVILLCDHSKFGNRGIFRIHGLEGIDLVITGKETPPEIIDRLKDSGMDVEVV